MEVETKDLVILNFRTYGGKVLKGFQNSLKSNDSDFL